MLPSGFCAKGVSRTAIRVTEIMLMSSSCPNFSAGAAMSMAVAPCFNNSCKRSNPNRRLCEIATQLESGMKYAFHDHSREDGSFWARKRAERTATFCLSSSCF
jgi:hypothetical protein